MATVESPIRLWEEIAELVASHPSAEKLLSYRPSDAAVKHVQTLLARLKENELTAEEQRELDQYEQAELFMRLVKARVRARVT